MLTNDILRGVAVIGGGAAFVSGGAAGLYRAGVLGRMWSWLAGVAREPAVPDLSVSALSTEPSAATRPPRTDDHQAT